MNVSKTLSLSIAASFAAIIAVAQEAEVAAAAEEAKTEAPAAIQAIEKTKEVIADVQEIAKAAEEPVPAAEEVAAPAAEVEAQPAEEAAVEDPADKEDKTVDLTDNGEDVPVTDDDEVEGITVTAADDPDKITVSLDAVELEDVVRLFTRLSGANIICNTTNLHGTVTANLANIGWKPAFRAILRQQGLALLEDPLNPDVYEIGVQPAKGQEPLITKTFKLSYLKASEAATILTSYLGLNSNNGAKKKSTDKDGNVIEEVEAVANDQKGYVVSYPAANTVVVSCRGENKMHEVEEVIAQLDVVRPQVYIEAKIVQVSGGASKKIGIDWSFMDGYKISAGPFNRNYEKTNTRDKGSSRVHTGDNADFYGTAHNYTKSLEYDEKLGVLNKVEHSPFAANYSGTPWDSLYRSEPADIYTGDHGAWKSDSFSKTKFSDETVTDVRSAIFDASAISLVMSALQTSDDVAQISNPKLIVANEERAKIDMTTKEPYVKVGHSINNENNSEEWSVEMDAIPTPAGKEAPYIEGAFFSYGISVDVTPRINNSSNITVVIEPTLSSLYKTSANPEGYYAPGDGYTRFPIINTKSVRTVFSLGNGQTAVIGGLTETSDSEVTKKIPLLGDIPILGKYLFSWSSKQKTQVETIIFVTVGIVNPDDKTTTMGLPDGARLVQKRIDENGKIIDKKFREFDKEEEAKAKEDAEYRAYLREKEIEKAKAEGIVIPEAVED